MKKSLTILSFFSLLIAFLFFINCDDNNQGPDNVGGAATGFTPNAPTRDSHSLNDPSYAQGFDPHNPNRGATVHYSTTRSRSTTTNTDPFYKNDEVLDNEEKWGTSAPITITSESVFADFRLGRLINTMDDIEDLRVYVSLRKDSSGKYYSGDIRIAYWEYDTQGSTFRETRYRSGRGSNAKYNVWFRKSNRDYFHGFFQEAHGSLIFVIDAITAATRNPDAPQQNTLYSGSLWVKQFRTTWNRRNSCNNHDNRYVFENNLDPTKTFIPPLAERTKNCWFITSGPFDCRTWKSGKGVNTFKAVNPDSCYSKMGRFNGLDLLKAFNISALSALQVHK